MVNMFNKRIRTLWGKDWEVETHPLSIPNEFDVFKSGFSVEIYLNKEVGIIGLVGLDSSDLNISPQYFNIVLKKVHEKTLAGKPYLIYSEEKYKSDCIEWNDKNNTTCNFGQFSMELENELKSGNFDERR